MLREEMLIRTCHDIPIQAENFQSPEQFHSVVKKFPSLQREILSAFTPKGPSYFSNATDIKRYLDEERMSVQNKRLWPNDRVSELFFKTYSHTHFKWTSNTSSTNLNPRYQIMLHPTEDLFTSNTSFFDEFRSELKSFQNEVASNGIYNLMRIRHHETNVYMTKPAEHPAHFIAKVWKFAWDLQADGESTNATLTVASIMCLAKFLLANNAVENGDAILDCGSSYGSLPLQLINAINVENNSIFIQGFGMEYASIRHILGSVCFYRMITLLKTIDYMPMKTFDCRLINQNLFFITEVPAKIKLMFSFDKVFEPTLLIHLALVALNSQSVNYFLTCRDSFHSKENGIRIGAAKVFKYQRLLEHLGFRKIATTDKAMRMNGGENSGYFTLYSVPRQQVDLKFLRNLQKDFFSPLGVSKFKNVEKWKHALSKKLIEDEMFPQMERSVKLDSQFVSEIETFYKIEGDLDRLETKKSLVKKVKEKVMNTCVFLNDFICHDYAKGNCVFCLKRFPSEERSSIELCYVDNAFGKGKGLFASKDVAKGEYICQYLGKKVSTGKVGNFVAQVDLKSAIDAEGMDSVGRFVNHSCKPNCSMQKVEKEYKEEKRTKTTLWIRSDKNILRGSEITIHYGNNFKDFFHNRVCLCDSCRKE